MEFAIAVLVAAGTNLCILVFLQKRYEPSVYRIVALTYLGTLTLRCLLAVFLWFQQDDMQFTALFWGDSGTYDAFGAAVAEGWKQEGSVTLWSQTLEGRVNSGFIYVVAVVYYIFGHNTLLMQFLNCTIGALTTIAIFEIGLLLYDSRVATRAMLLSAFFPQMVFWSAALYKDAAVMLCIALAILAALQLRQRSGLVWLLIYVAAAGALVWLRFYIFYAIMAASFAGLLSSHRRGPLFGLMSQVALVGSVILLLLYTPTGREIQNRARFLDLQQLQNARSDLAVRANTGFASDADVSTPLGVLSTLPIGVMYLLFAPFPWTVGSVRQVLSLPDVLVWYALMPALIRGLRSAVRHRLAQTLPILVFTTALTLAYGAFLGNAGTAYRQRTQIMMFYFIFIADGLKKRQSQELDEVPATENAGAQLSLTP